MVERGGRRGDGWGGELKVLSVGNENEWVKQQKLQQGR